MMVDNSKYKRNFAIIFALTIILIISLNTLTYREPKEKESSTNQPQKDFDIDSINEMSTVMVGLMMVIVMITEVMKSGRL